MASRDVILLLFKVTVGQKEFLDKNNIPTKYQIKLKKRKKKDLNYISGFELLTQNTWSLSLSTRLPMRVYK